MEVLKNIFYVFSRMILQDTAVFLHLLQANPSPEGVQLLDKLLDVWWRRVRINWFHLFPCLIIL